MKVAVIMGSTSDWGVMSAAVETLEQLGIEYEKREIGRASCRERVLFLV